MCCALAFILTVLEAEKQKMEFFSPNEYVTKNEGQIALTAALCC